MENTEQITALTGWDENNEIKLVCKQGGKRLFKTIKNFQWYFVLTQDDYEKAGDVLFERYADANVVTKLEKFGNYVKVYANKNVERGPDQSRTLRELFSDLKKKGAVIHEGDLSMTKRYVTDKNIEVASDLDILYFDIETDDSHDGIEIGRDEILSWAACDTKGNTWYETGDEKTILGKLVNLINDHDVFCGWNSGQFDLPYIKERMKKHGMVYEWRKRIHLDMMQRATKVYSYEMYLTGLTGFSLNEFARVFLNQQKVVHTESIKEMYDNNPELLKEYNIKDAELLRELDKKLLMTELMIKECQWTGAFLDRFYIGELLDNYILRKSKEAGIFQRTRPDFTEKAKLDEITIRGGYVMDPVCGLHTNVRVCDFKSLYPSIIVGWNIGQDSLNEELSSEGFENFCKFLNVGTAEERKIEDVGFDEWWAFLAKQKKMLDPRNENIQAANNTFFRRDTTSFIGAMVQNLLTQRAEWKKQMKSMTPGTPEYNNINSGQGVVKEMANSMYGITADKASRYFNRYIAEAITITGQFMNKTSSAIAKTFGHLTIYGDTDSIFMIVEKDEIMDTLIESINAKLKKFLNEKIGVHRNIVSLEYEKTFGRLIMLDKKRYTGVLTMKDGNATYKMFSRGTEDIKKNTIDIARRAFVELTGMIVKDDVSLEVAREWLNKLKDKIINSKLDMPDLIIRTKVSKSVDSYKSKSIHVRLADRLIKEGKLLPIKEKEGSKSWGTRLEYIVHIDPVTGKQEAILPEEFKGQWDVNYYWDTQVYAPLCRVFQIVWPDEDWESYTIAMMEKRQREKEREEKKAAKLIMLDEKKMKALEKKKKSDEKKAELARLSAERKSKKKKKDEQLDLFTSVE